MPQAVSTSVSLSKARVKSPWGKKTSDMCAQRVCAVGGVYQNFGLKDFLA